MRVYLASDHAGYELKNQIRDFLAKEGYEIEDLGPSSYDANDDYPDLIRPAAEKISQNPEDRAIILGGSGQGEAMVSNRYKNVRAAVYYGGNRDIIKLSREHNNANVLSFGARFVTTEEALQVAKLWLETPFSSEERHHRRVKKIDKES